MEIAVHSELDTTMNIYGHVDLDAQREALDALAGRFSADHAVNRAVNADNESETRPRPGRKVTDRRIQPNRRRPRNTGPPDIKNPGRTYFGLGFSLSGRRDSNP
jgi:hypothetical protein